MKLAKFRNVKNDKTGPVTLVREGTTVKTYTDLGKTFNSLATHQFPTVSAAKAFMNRPVL